MAKLAGVLNGFFLFSGAWLGCFFKINTQIELIKSYFSHKLSWLGLGVFSQVGVLKKNC